MRILFSAAELFPYLKVGGLADVMAALPKALRAQGADVRLCLPAFPALKSNLGELEEVGYIPDLLRAGEARILLGRGPGEVPIYLVDCPPYFYRPGNPYEEWGDSHRKFGAFSWASAHLAKHGDAKGWKPQVLHVNDWQAALGAVHLASWGEPRPATVATIHNIAYQGIYGAHVIGELWLPPDCFHMGGVEFFGMLNFLKGGLAYADRISTVSPTYAQEIQLPGGGEGLDGLLRFRAQDLVGILNGVDREVWNPETDPAVVHPFTAKTLSERAVNKDHLQRRMGLQVDPVKPLFGLVSRLTPIKGLDLMLENIGHLLDLDAQLVLLGTGEPALEEAFRGAAGAHPGQVAVLIGYDEDLARQIYSGADVVVVPSRQEPCGLSQMYAMRYGALPLVRRSGGLADTVVDISAQTLLDGTATGFVFQEANSWMLGEALARVCQLYRQEPDTWRKAQRHAMAVDFSWEASARKYLKLYHEIARP